MNLGYRISPDLFVIPDKEVFILYDPIRPSAAMVNGAGVQALAKIRAGQGEIAALPTEFFDRLQKSGIIATGETCPAPHRFPKRANQFDPRGVSLFLTTQCSLRCIYCYSGGGDESLSMPWATAEAAIQWIARHVADQGGDTFFLSLHGGGEITTAKALLQRCVICAKEAAAQYGLGVKIEAGLNGIMGPSTLAWVVQNVDNATISLDGLPAVQNYQRPLADGGGSFERVAATLKELDRLGFRYAIRSTITQERMASMAAGVAYMIHHFKPRAIQVEPAFIVGRALEKSLAPVDGGQFVDQFRIARSMAKEKGINLKYSGARFGTTTNVFCKAATGNAFAVTPDGVVSACYEVTAVDDGRAPLFFYGRWDGTAGEFRFDQERIETLRTLCVENKTACRHCFCKWHCAGDCAAKLALQGDAWSPDLSERCYINRELTKDLIKEHFFSKET